MLKKFFIAVISALMLALMAIPTFAASTILVGNEAELLAALGTAQNGDTIQLSASIELETESVLIASAKEIIIDLNGYNLKAPEGYPAIDVCGKLTITDSVVDGKGYGKGQVIGNHESVILISQGGIFTLKNGTLSGGNPDKRAYGRGGGVENWGTFYMNGGKISGCTATMGGGLSCEEGSKAYISGGEITNCYAPQAGGGVYCDWESYLEMTGGEINLCVTDLDGGGMATTPTSEVHLRDCRIINNNSGIANGCDLYIGGNIVVMGNILGTNEQNNICILSETVLYERDLTIAIEPNFPLGKDADVGLHMANRSYGNVAISSGALEEYVTSGKLSADFDGDTLVYEDGKVLIDIAEITVTFDSQGGSDVAPVKVKRGYCISEPAKPTKEGYEFVGWFPNLTSTEPCDFDFDVYTKDTTIYAKWKEATNPLTGDHSNAVLWIVIIGVAVVVIAVLLVVLLRKRKRTDD